MTHMTSPVTLCDVCATSPATVAVDLTTFGDDLMGADPMTHMCDSCASAIALGLPN